MREAAEKDYVPGADKRGIEQLRDRTDELELIISSLTTFALFSIPSWLMSTIADSFTHLSTTLVIVTMIMTPVITGVAYGLAVCFVIHLMARAYWVGLIGLKTVFPDGINWGRTPGLGPVSQEHLKTTLPDLSTVIRKTDRLASSLFAVISMLTLSILWFGSIMVAIVAVAGTLGARFGQTNFAMTVAMGCIVLVFAGLPLIVYLLDGQLAKRIPAIGKNRVFAAIIRFMRRVAGLAFPQRLVLPVQLTLQSNTRPLIFLLILSIAITTIIFVGTINTAAWRNITVSQAFTYATFEDFDGSFRSGFYEDMASPKEKLRSWPRIPTFEQRGSFIRLFLPYQPLRDNLILEQLCGDPDTTPNRTDCLRRLWQVSVGDQQANLSEFMLAERSDLNMLGLIGLVPIKDLDPGMHTLKVIWNPEVDDYAGVLDDRYSDAVSTFNIAFHFAPEFEQSMPELSRIDHGE